MVKPQPVARQWLERHGASDMFQRAIAAIFLLAAAGSVAVVTIRIPMANSFTRAPSTLAAG